MASITGQIGIDVAKDELVASIDQGKSFAVPNSVQGLALLAKRLPEGGIVHLEASGGYERLAVRELRKAGFTVETHNPLKVRRFVQATRGRAKTDSLDAQALAAAGAALKGSQAKSEERQRLEGLSRAIESLKQDRSDRLRNLKAPELEPEVAASYRELVEQLTAHIQALEATFQKQVKAGSFKADYLVLLSLPGIGSCAARNLIAELPENYKETDPKKICGYTGLAPYDDSSGKRNGTKRIGPGNSRLKAALYMCAVNLIASRDWAKELYAKLKAKGKAHQSAIVAVMRRLLLRCLAVLKRGTPWQEVPPQA